MALTKGDRVSRTSELCRRLGEQFTPAQKGTVKGFESKEIVLVRWDAPVGSSDRIHIDNLIHPLVVQEDPI